jgi:hypothetical protein
MSLAQVDPTTLKQLKEICEREDISVFIDLFNIAIKFIGKTDGLKNDVEGAKKLFFTTIVDICDGEDDKFGTDDDVFDIADKLDQIRSVSDAVVIAAFKAIEHEAEIKLAVDAAEKKAATGWTKIQKFFQKRR